MCAPANPLKGQDYSEPTEGKDASGTTESACVWAFKKLGYERGKDQIDSDESMNLSELDTDSMEKATKLGKRTRTTKHLPIAQDAQNILEHCW